MWQCGAAVMDLRLFQPKRRWKEEDGWETLCLRQWGHARVDVWSVRDLSRWPSLEIGTSLEQRFLRQGLHMKFMEPGTRFLSCYVPTQLEAQQTTQHDIWMRTFCFSPGWRTATLRLAMASIGQMCKASYWIPSWRNSLLMGVLSHQTSTYLALARFDLSEDFFRSLGGLHSESIDVTGKTTKTTFKSLKYPKCGARLAQMLGILRRGSLWSRQWFHKKHLLWGERIPHRILLILASGALKDRHICEMHLQWETTNWQYIQGCLHAKKRV